jgi:hypothetical protein
MKKPKKPKRGTKEIVIKTITFRCSSSDSSCVRHSSVYTLDEYEEQLKEYEKYRLAKIEDQIKKLEEEV